MKWIFSVIAILVLYTFSYCEVLPDGTKYNLYNDFTGGLNTSDPAHKLRQDESPYIRNCLIDEGEIDPPGGTSIIGSTASLQKINLFKRYVKDDGNIEFIVSDSSIVLKTQDFSQYVLLKSGLNSAYRLRAKQVESKMYFTNGSDSCFTYNGTTVVVLDGGTYNIGKTPNMPKFKYLEYYQNRLWGFNLPDNPSALRWNVLNSTDIVPIAYPPDHELAWTNSNLQLNIDKGNGTVGTFLRVYAGQLFAGKERGIHYIYGNDDTNYSAVPIVKDYGFLSDESVVEQDNLLYGFGNDGIYEFNGQQMTRISDKIFPDIQAINSGVTKNSTLSWDSFSDFSRGYVNGSTITKNGFITYRSTWGINYIANQSSMTPLYFTPIITDLSTPYVPMSTNSLITNEIANGLFYKPSTCTFRLYCPVLSPNNCFIHFKNKSSGNICEATATLTSVGSGNYEALVNASNWNYNGFLLSSADINTSNWSFQGQVVAAGCPSGICEIDFSSANIIGHADVVLITTSPEQYVSDIATTTSLSNWNLFNSLNTQTMLNGVNFYYHASTSASMLSTAAWVSISPGAVIGSSSTNIYIQWAATISAVNNFIDNVQIIYQTGGGADVNALGSSWKNRYYLFVTTNSNATTTLCYVKSRSGTKNPYGWTVLEGINIKSSLVTPDVWYLGSSNSGIISRCDYGTNYNGNVINQIYKTNENNFGQPFLNKNILEYGVDTDYGTNSSFSIFTSIDSGVFSEQSIDTNGTGRMIRRLSNPYVKGNSFQWMFVNTQLNKPMRIYNWIVYFKENATRTNTP